MEPLIRFVEKTLVVAELEARKLRHDPTELLTRAIQPALWFVVLGGLHADACDSDRRAPVHGFLLMH